jgi:Helix-turn-helix domain
MKPGPTIIQTTSGPVAKKYLTVPDAVNYSNISRTSLYKEINDGRIKSVKVKGIRMVSIESLDQFIESFAA